MRDKDTVADTNWAHLFHAYGVATNTPGFLRDLTSNDSAKRVAAVDHLTWSVLHQGTIYSVTPVVVKVLMGLLDNPVLYEDMYEFYHAKNKTQHAQVKKQLSSPDIAAGLETMLKYKLAALEKQLSSQKP